ncbi:MAG: cyclase family protein [Methanosarcinales archaeon]|nr:cyclase family protein [Methanosarcinales archaeon]
MIVKEIYDISLPLGEDCQRYPGDTPFCRQQLCRLEEAGYNLFSLTMSSHAGTHLDSPAHLVVGGRTIDQIAPQELILPARVAFVPGQGPIVARDIQDLDLSPGEALLFKTENSASGLSRSPRFREDYVCLSPGAAELCLRRGAALVGIDCLSVDRFDDPGLPVHKILLGHGIPILEGIDLGRVDQGSYTLICLPLNITDAEASPARALLVR